MMTLTNIVRKMQYYMKNRRMNYRGPSNKGLGQTSNPTLVEEIKVTVDLQVCLPKNHSHARLLCYQGGKTCLADGGVCIFETFARSITFESIILQFSACL